MRTNTEQTKALLTATESAVLGLLTKGERSGYDLHKLAERSVGHVWAPAKSQIYAVLPRLLKGGYATRRTVRQDQRPDKQLYRITRKGERALRGWLSEDARSHDEFLLKVFFGGLLDRPALAELVERRRDEARADLATYREIEKRIGGRAPDRFAYLTLRWGLARSRALIRWCDEVLADVAVRDEGG